MAEEDFEGLGSKKEMFTIKERSGDQESTEQCSTHYGEDVSMQSELESKIGSQSCIFYEEEEFEVTRILGANEIIFEDLDKNKAKPVRKMSSMSMTDYENDVNSDPTFELQIDQNLSSFSPKMKAQKEEEEKKTVSNQPKATHVQQPKSNTDDLQVTGFMVFGDQEITTMY